MKDSKRSQDLLDSTSLNKSDTTSVNTRKVNVLVKLSIQINESSNGVISLAESNKVSVSTLKEMVACLEHGSLSKATGSTNINNQSSFSHELLVIKSQNKLRSH